MKKAIWSVMVLGTVISGCSSVRTREMDRIKEKIEAREGDIAACYRKLRPPRPPGEVWVSFRFDVNGKVLEQSIAESTLGVPPVETCILGVFRSIRFDPPYEKLPVQTNYPIRFKDEE